MRQLTFKKKRKSEIKGGREPHTLCYPSFFLAGGGYMK
jgi:hypothetical protein